MRAVKTLTVGDISFEVRELTVADIRLWLQELINSAEPDLVAEALFNDISLADIPRLSSLTMAQVETMTPSELRQVIDAAKGVNADFFTLRNKLIQAARVLPAAA
ncbi:hypothetical protein ACFQNF_19545 [Iodobacter arcticus]|jgi:hypothetical protein|uniref:Uncharacterized protein n=1 Tax=Iodobacter arcticus TaxID=590593 RepID=A0ABW2R2A7_9NEIS